ncbi:hypothetical protein [Cohaesibacter intestini]|uniref:hypothetical protein n=1 Tax=Cohaesibacter intestini TaxID=2211145 RepID=UPI0013003B39|nr:hypothetical protein [Cohaesibacter intestini]
MNSMFDTNLPIVASTICVDATPTLEDLKVHVESNPDLADVTKERYVHAIERVSVIRNQPLAMIPASLDLVEVTFPRDGYDPVWWTTERAYRLFRRRLQAPLRDYLGVREALQQARAQQDGWSYLIDACLDQSAGIPELMGFHRSKFPSLKLLADIARREGIQPHDMDAEVAGVIYRAAPSGKRETVSKGLKLFDRLRDYEFAAPYLPYDKIGFSASRLRQQQNSLPAHWEAEFELIFAMMNEHNVDPVTQEITALSPETKTFFRAAMRGLARTYLKAHPHINRDKDWINLCSFRSNINALATAMIDRCKLPKGAEDKIAPRTARKYLSKLARVLHEFAPDSFGLQELTQILKNNEILQEGKEADSKMTPENIKFCQSLFDDKKLKTRFLTSYRVFFEEAVQMMNDVASQGRELSCYERIKVRWLGTCAAFCALELGGMPIRIENAMGLTMHGVDAQIKILQRNKKEAKIRVPKGLVKNKKPIRFELKPHTNGYLEVLTWYVDVIRPMFEHADSNPYFFPAPKSASKSMSEGYFCEQFAKYTRSVLGLPMTPHQMRHGQVSLLLQRYPERILIIAHRIGDTLKTMFDYYGWIDEVRLIEEGQMMIAEMTDE